jgi:hypothetical protein
MSRGLGAVQRSVIARLRANTAHPMDDWDNEFASWTSMADLAGSVDRAKVESTRRAVLKLEEAGLVETLLVWRNVPLLPYSSWRSRTVVRQLLVARIPPPDQINQRWRSEFEARNERSRHALDALVALDKRIG